MIFVPKRPFLKLPAWVWPLVPITLGIVIWLMGPPDLLPEPPLGAAAFQAPVLVTKTGKTFRFVPFGSEQNVRPLWFIKVSVGDLGGAVRWQFGWVDRQLILGLYKRERGWLYMLGSAPVEGSFKDGKVTVPHLTESELKIVRALLIEELNGRYPDEHLGSQLEQALAGGVEQVSYMCMQNAIIIILWLSLVLAMAAVWTMFLPQAAPVDHTGDTTQS